MRSGEGRWVDQLIKLLSCPALSYVLAYELGGRRFGRHNLSSLFALSFGKPTLQRPRSILFAY